MSGKQKAVAAAFGSDDDVDDEATMASPKTRDTLPASP